MKFSVPVIRRRPVSASSPRSDNGRLLKKRSIAGLVLATGLGAGALVTTSTSPATAAATPMRLTHAISTNQCLEILNWDGSNGAQAGTWQCHGGANQRWEKVPAADGLYMLRSLMNGKCLEVLSWSTQSGGKIGMWDCHGGANQIWGLNSPGWGGVIQKNKHSGLCIDTGFSTPQNGNRAVQLTCTLDRSAWIMTEWPKPTPADFGRPRG